MAGTRFHFFFFICERAFDLRLVSISIARIIARIELSIIVLNMQYVTRDVLDSSPLWTLWVERIYISPPEFNKVANINFRIIHTWDHYSFIFYRIENVLCRKNGNEILSMHKKWYFGCPLNAYCNKMHRREKMKSTNQATVVATGWPDGSSVIGQ